jgi:hypothetical protein
VRPAQSPSRQVSLVGLLAAPVVAGRHGRPFEGGVVQRHAQASVEVRAERHRIETRREARPPRGVVPVVVHAREQDHDVGRVARNLHRQALERLPGGRSGGSEVDDREAAGLPLVQQDL